MRSSTPVPCPAVCRPALQCTLSEEDATYYHQLKTEQRLAYRSILDKLHIDPDLLGGERWRCGGGGGCHHTGCRLGGACCWRGLESHWLPTVQCRSGTLACLHGRRGLRHTRLLHDTAPLLVHDTAPPPPAPDGDPSYDNYKRPKLNSKMIKLRGMVTTLRKAAASE